MKRHRVPPRPDWRRKVEAVGLAWHGDGAYWDESVAYEFTAAEVDTIEMATNELHRLCLSAADRILAEPRLLDRFLIPPEFHDYLRRSWGRRDPTLYGRFDLAFDPANPALVQPKLLEYNADTPTTLIESAVVQWHWLGEAQPDADQFNSVHERLIERWKLMAPLMAPGSAFHLSSYPDVEEERMTVEYLADTLEQAGIDHRFVGLEDVGWDRTRACFTDLEGAQIRYWFKLYPWEWLVRDKFAPHLLEDRVGIIEPVWKMLLSNKAILPALWELFPGHPNLLPASFEPGQITGDVVVKPILAREGSNIELRRAGRPVLATPGEYGDAPRIYQQAAALPAFDSNYAVIGSWIVGEESAGMCLREDTTPIIGAASRVVPHFFR
jgi:glutathionylspermidine synthase